jgi:hypothetical protein
MLMSPRRLRLGVSAACTALVIVLGCTAGEPTLSKDDLLSRMEAAGLRVEPLDDAGLPTDAIAELPEEPTQAFLVRVSDGQGNSTAMTFTEFDSSEKTGRIRGVNGFPVRNWFVVGIVSNDFRDAIQAATAP